VKAKVAVLYIEGTNCEDEGLRAFNAVGLDAEKVHLKQLTGDCAKERRRSMFDYDMLFLPGGWSAGDYIRAGAIFAARMKSRLRNEIVEFTSEGRFIVGVCNGFQILTEVGLLPGFNGMSEVPEAALAINENGRFQCRPTYIKHENACTITCGIKKGAVMQVPVAHAEGRLTFGSRNKDFLKKLLDNNQVVFRYCRKDGSPADGTFPWNPNGSLYDIAGICNPDGNVLGMMPHPERVVDRIQNADWSRSNNEGDSLMFFKSIATYIKKQR